MAGIAGLAAGPVAALVPLGIAPALIMLGVLAGGLMWMRRRAWPPLDKGILAPLALFLAYGALSIAWTPVPKDGAAQILTFLYEIGPALLLFGFAPGLEDGVRRRVAGWTLAGMAAGLALYGVEVLFDQPIYRYAKSLEEGRMAMDRALNRPSVIFAVLVWPAALMLWRLGRPRAAWLPPLSFFALIMFSPSASAVSGLAAGLCVFLLAWASARIARRVLMAFVAAGFALSVPLAHGLWSSGLLLDERIPFSFRHRIEIWKFTALRIGEKPWFGWGLDSSRAIPGKASAVIPGGGVAEALPLHPHNLFLQSLLELGIVGSIPLAALLLRLLNRTGYLPADSQPFALAAFASALVIASFAYGAWQTWWVCTLLMTLFLLLIAKHPFAPSGR